MFFLFPTNRRGERHAFPSPQSFKEWLAVLTPPVKTEGHRNQYFELIMKMRGCGWLVALGCCHRLGNIQNGQNFLGWAGQLISESPIGKFRHCKWELACLLFPRENCRRAEQAEPRDEQLETTSWWRGSYVTS